MDLLDLELKYKNNDDVLELINRVKDLEEKEYEIPNYLNSIENALDEANSYFRELKKKVK